MQVAPNATTRRTVSLHVPGLVRVPAVFAAFIAVSALNAQAPSSPPSALAPETTPVVQPSPSQQPTQPGQAPVLSTPPIAIVPLDKAIPGAALSVAGQLQAWNGRAFITASGTVTAGNGTAQITLPHRGTLRVCASSTVKLAADSSAPTGEVPGLLIALDHGAVEMSFAASSAREQNADTLLTPYFHILIGGPNAADVKVRLGDHGDTCVDNAGANAPYVVVTSVFDGGLYRVQAGQRVMFEHGSLQTVVDQEKEPCGCPPAPAEAQGNEFPLAQSEGLAPIPPSPPATVANQTAGSGQAATTLVYKAADHAPETVAIPLPSSAPAPAAPANQPAQARGAQKKPGFFRRIGRFFKRIFGAE